MNFLVQMDLADSGRAMTSQQGMEFIEQLILPSLECLTRLESGGTIQAGGPVAGSIALRFFIEAESAESLDQLLGGLPIWPRMKTTVTPLTSSAHRAAALKPRLAELRSQLTNPQHAER
jgi:muconolactone delta-isomerase